jgi:hypothetical protein
MAPFSKVSWSRFAPGWSIAPLLAATLISLPARAQTSAPEPSAESETVEIIETTEIIEIPETAADTMKPLNQPNSQLGMVAGRRLMAEAEQAINAQNYDQAISKLQAARENLQAAAGFYQQLFNAFSGIDTRVADNVRAQAVEAAQLRDQATYQQALAYRAQNKPESAVPLLVEIIQSQNPTRELGGRAYTQLFELGFVNLPYPRGSE